ncbi:hypothetical protein FSP39_010579 [Pinctada imbricata]|uniref:Secreted protein n=1 Tax=Pinctada imbricata TaxID=66713 RepID=A0AA88Y4M4_PINIB|nr:hypothetical protein FSP39_010579 [Pinctada imbricata]
MLSVKLVLLVPVAIMMLTIDGAQLDTVELSTYIVEALLDMTDMVTEESSSHKQLRQSQVVESDSNVKRVIEAICSFTNPFDIESTSQDLYCLSSGVPAKSDLLKTCLMFKVLGKLK